MVKTKHTGEFGRRGIKEEDDLRMESLAFTR